MRAFIGSGINGGLVGYLSFTAGFSVPVCFLFLALTIAGNVLIQADDRS